MKHLLLLSLSLTGSCAKAQTFENNKNLFDPSPYAFSHSAVVPQNSQLIFISGQCGAEDKEHKLSSDFRTQVRFTLKNLVTILESYDLNPENVANIK